MGAALFTVGAIQGFGSGDSGARVAAQIVTGIGFLGAGTILHMRNRIVGLTTAAGMWAVAAVGLTIGAGLYILGVGPLCCCSCCCASSAQAGSKARARFT
jgi:putative Mg2+ transporter-C (MgtC) family protein